MSDASYWHRLNKRVIEEFRANNGELKSRKWPVILLTTTGARTGRKHVTPLNFSRDALRNDGTPGVPFKEGERMDDFKLFVGKPNDGKRYDLSIDDVIFFANDPNLPSEPEPFPNRVIHLTAFDTGPKEKYWLGDFEIVEKDLPPDSYGGWRVLSRGRMEKASSSVCQSTR